MSEQEKESESQVVRLLACLLKSMSQSHHSYLHDQLEWQEHCVSAEKLTAALKERLEAVRQELKEQGTVKEELQSDLLATREELKTFKIRSKQDQYKINEV